MLQIYDKARLLNFSYTEIYFLLNEKEFEEYEKVIKALNRCPSVTRGLFHFDVIKRGEQMYARLPDEMKNEMMANVLVRIIDAPHGYYVYALTFINLKQEFESLKARINELVDDICKEDLRCLDIIKNRNTSSAYIQNKKYEEAGIVSEIFENALKGIVANHKEEGDVRGSEIVEKTYNTANRKASHEIVAGALSNDVNRIIERQYFEQNDPKLEGEISVSIKNVPTGKFYKSGVAKYGLGFEFNILDERIPVFVSSTDQKILYATALYCQQNRQPLHKNVFTKAPDAKHIDMHTLKKVHEIFARTGRFEDWYNAVKGNNPSNYAHRIDTAFSAINTAIWNALKDRCPEAYYYCCLRHVNKKHIDGQYRTAINLLRDNEFTVTER